jgi:hypothetical protein
MDFNPASLLLSFVISGVGFVLFSYGRKMQRFPQLVAGLSLMVFPYFVSSALVSVGIAVAILGGLWAFLNFGT